MLFRRRSTNWRFSFLASQPACTCDCVDRCDQAGVTLRQLGDRPREECWGTSLKTNGLKKLFYLSIFKQLTVWMMYFYYLSDCEIHHSSCRITINWLTDWLTDWLIDWLLGWLKACSQHMNWTEQQQVDPVTRRVRWSRASASRLDWLQRN